MKEIFAVFLIVIFIIAAFLGLTWVAQGNEFFLYKVFAPKMEQVRRDTFENSKAYNQGMLQQLERQQLEYVKGDESVKDAISSMILHDFADYDDSKLPSNLYTFMQDVRHRTLTQQPEKKSY